VPQVDIVDKEKKVCITLLIIIRSVHKWTFYKHICGGKRNVTSDFSFFHL